jgi:uncharacterized membrane protein YphA (DoxX/SURF4 family)
MDALFLIGRIMFSVVFILNGVAHLTLTDQLAGYAESRGVRSSRLLTQISGVALVLGGLGVLLGIWMDAAALGLFVVAFLIAVFMHGFWNDSGEQRTTEMAQFNKDMGLAGGALLLFVFVQQFDGLPFTILDNLF